MVGGVGQKLYEDVPTRPITRAGEKELSWSCPKLLFVDIFRIRAITTSPSFCPTPLSSRFHPLLRPSQPARTHSDETSQEGQGGRLQPQSRSQEAQGSVGGVQRRWYVRYVLCTWWCRVIVVVVVVHAAALRFYMDTSLCPPPHGKRQNSVRR